MGPAAAAAAAALLRSNPIAAALPAALSFVATRSGGGWAGARRPTHTTSDCPAAAAPAASTATTITPLPRLRPADRIPAALEVIAEARRRASAAAVATAGPTFASSAPALLDVAAVSAHPPLYTRGAFEAVAPEHLPPTTLRQRVAHRLILGVRTLFDKATGYREGAVLTEAQWLSRCILLETVAGVPGFVGGALRHLQSLRLMRPDGGRINTLLEESENERMHLLTFLELRRPGRLFRAAVTVAQGVAWNAYFAAFLLSPRSCHAFVGYLEEQAVRTYTHLLAEMDTGRVFVGAPAPEVARLYWRLGEDATLRDVVLAIRADEKAHAEVNHTLSLIDEHAPNPFATATGGPGDGGGKCRGGGGGGHGECAPK